MGTIIRENDAGRLTFDNVLEESFVRSATVTQYPIQNTAQHTDHRQQQWLELTIQGLITETPIEEFLYADGPSEFGEGFQGAEIGEGAVRSLASLEFFRLAEPELLRYFSRRLGFIDDLFITNLAYRVTNRQDLVYTIDLVQVKFSQSVKVDLPPLRVRQEAPATCPTVDVGPRAAKDVGGAGDSDVRDASLALQGVEALTDRQGAGAIQALDEGLRALFGR